MQLCMRTSGLGQETVSIGNKGTRSGDFTPDLGLLRVQ